MMKRIIYFTSALVILNSCSLITENQNYIIDETVQSRADKTLESDLDTIFTDDELAINYSIDNRGVNEIPPDGNYRFDIAFAEWQGKSMGEKVTVIISGDSIKIIYEGDGQLSQVEKGEVIDEGRIMKHKSGDWIVGANKSEIELDEIGGCSGGPAIIDFKNKKYWMC